MLLLRRTLLGCVLVGSYITDVLAQTPLRGVVWDAPVPPLARDLFEMKSAGVDALRLPLLPDASLLPVADSLGLQLFQDLPIQYLPAALLADTLRATQELLAQALQRSTPYSSARHFGFAYLSDTSDPKACAFFEALAQDLRSLPEAKAYYVTAFAGRDRCAHAADLVLLDLRNVSRPDIKISAWPHPTPIGVGALGIEGNSTHDGLRHPNSPQSQARYLEMHLKPLLHSELPAVFVYRWKDIETKERIWGLVSEDGTERPAHGVLQGLFTGSQTNFAFALGISPDRSVPWVILYGWIVVLLAAVLYGSSPRWRSLFVRYFRGHAFYVDAIRSGRETTVGSSTVFLGVQSLVVGTTICLLAELAIQAGVVDAIRAAIGPRWQSHVRIVVSHPPIQLFLFACLYAAIQLATTSVAALAAGGLRSFQFKRVFAIQIGAKWMYVLLLPLVMATASLPTSSSVRMISFMAVAWILILIYSTVRAALDCAAVFPRRKFIAALGTGILPVLLILLCIGLLVLTEAGQYAAFWWRLLVVG